MSKHKTYIMFSFEWTTMYQAYEYAFNCQTGQMAEDHGELDGNPADFRFVIAVNGITRLSDIEWDAMGTDLFTDDLPEMGKALAKHAGFDATQILRKPPDNGEAIFVWSWYGGVTESSANGPGEGWTETYYIGELGELNITKPVYEQEDKVFGIDLATPKIIITTTPIGGNPWYKRFLNKK